MAEADEKRAPRLDASDSKHSHDAGSKEAQHHEHRRVGVEFEIEVKQDGVKQVEAITSVWTNRAMVLTFVVIYVISFVDTLQQQITSNLAPYVTSSFNQHSLLATTNVMSGIIAGVTRLPLAKLIDIWGRVEGFSLMLFFCTLGLVLMAVCQNVETYAAAQVFYWVGFNGMNYVIAVLVSDATSVKNRSIIFGLISTPYIATTFAGPDAAQQFYEHSNFRWAFGAFSIITLIISLPLIVIFVFYHMKAKKQGIAPPRGSSGRNFSQSLIYYIREFDVIGTFLVVAGFALILLPLTLAAQSLNRWKSAHIIAMIVLGVVVLIAFGIWEKFFAPVSFLPFRYMKDRTILGACILSGSLFVSFYCWDIYFSSYLQVVHQLSIRDAGYVLNIYTLGACGISPIVGLIIRWTGKFKLLAMIAIPFTTLGTALLVHFRHPHTHLGYIIMCQIFIAFAGGTLVICQQIAVMAVVTHNEIAVVFALLGLFSSIGGSIGQSIAGTIWTNSLLPLLEEHLPEASKQNATLIYGSLATQLSYQWGSPERDAIVKVYGIVQRRLAIAGSAVMPVAIISILVWENIDVRGLKQTKGRVF
ncbi:MFS general substrate transporter [Patellaria atrata CBS 101060]|uniref:MFS general substrate transporter n=1 Tax=Patellaria atrata CBS 101060 TaxID=1346257 RepID=A0A9P4SH57_9PEZI|nr:MFS general substrate transporter [Patellaria atrata CBS 101060]